MKVETARKRNWALRLIKCMKAQIKVVRFFFEEAEEFEHNKGNWQGATGAIEFFLKDIENKILTELPAKKEKNHE